MATPLCLNHIHDDELKSKLFAAYYDIRRFQAMLAEANKQIIDVYDGDGITFDGYQVIIHEDNMASQVRARLRLGSHHQVKAIIRELLAQCMELDQDKRSEWRELDMTWVL